MIALPGGYWKVIVNVFNVCCRYACNVEGEGIVLKTAPTKTKRAASRRNCVTTVEILTIPFLIVLFLWKDGIPVPNSS